MNRSVSAIEELLAATMNDDGAAGQATFGEACIDNAVKPTKQLKKSHMKFDATFIRQVKNCDNLVTSATEDKNVGTTTDKVMILIQQYETFLEAESKLCKLEEKLVRLTEGSGNKVT